jgi:Phage P22-like portal protein
MSENDEFTRLMLKRSEEALGHNADQFRKVSEDMLTTHIHGHSWDEHMKKLRDNRPCYEFNRQRQLVRRVTGQMLQNKTQIKVRPFEDGDKDLADIRSGLIRAIEIESHADLAYDTANVWAVTGGFGAYMVTYDWESDDSFDKVLRIEEIQDPLSLRCDPVAMKYDRSDARYWFRFGRFVPKEEFERLSPGKPLISFDSAENGANREWFAEEGVREADYWYKEPAKKYLYRMTDGRVLKAEQFAKIGDELDRAGITVKDERTVDGHDVYHCKVYGKGALGKPTKWIGSHIPIIPVWGDLFTIEGKQYFSGMSRHSNDSQRLHNFWLSTLAEVVAKMPNSPMVATPTMIAGLEDYYNRLGWDDPKVLLYNADPLAPGGRPMRENMQAFPVALANMAQISSEEMKATTGVYDASIGAKSNETSGRAIMVRNAQGDTANFVYSDNDAKSKKRLAEILLDLIPAVYDGERTVRILGEDMAEKVQKLNETVRDEATGEMVVMNDMSKGRYDAVVSTGKSFETQRVEMAEAAQALSADPSPLGLLGKYMLLKNLDVPGMDEYTTAARKLMVSQGLLEPGEGDQPKPPPPPNPKDAAGAEKDAAQAKKLAAETEGVELANMETATRMGVQMGEAGIPLPNAHPQPPQMPPEMPIPNMPRQP